MSWQRRIGYGTSDTQEPYTTIKMWPLRILRPQTFCRRLKLFRHDDRNRIYVIAGASDPLRWIEMIEIMQLSKYPFILCLFQKCLCNILSMSSIDTLNLVLWVFHYCYCYKIKTVHSALVPVCISITWKCVCVCVCVSVCVCACVRACVRACVDVCMRPCMRVYAVSYTHLTLPTNHRV